MNMGNSEDNYHDYTENQLISMAQKGDIDAEEILMRRYKEAVRIKAKMYYMAGADEDDIVQEGMIGLLKAIRKYRNDRDTTFGTFASVCITRQIISAARSAGRSKHKALNTSVSLSNPVEQEAEGVTIADTLRTDNAVDPENLLVIKDITYYILHNGDNIFSDFEMQVLNELLKGNDYEKIARRLDKTPKSIDNAMQRVKKKIINYLWR